MAAMLSTARGLCGVLAFVCVCGCDAGTATAKLACEGSMCKLPAAINGPSSLCLSVCVFFVCLCIVFS